MAQAQLIGHVIGLRGAIAKRDVQRKASRIVGKIPAENLAQQIAVAAHEGRRRRRTPDALEAGFTWPLKPLLVNSKNACNWGSRRVPGAAQVDHAALHIDLGLLDLGPLRQRLFHQFRGRLEILLLRHPDVVQRKNVHVIQPLARDAVPAQRVLEDRFLLRHVGLRDQQVLLGGRNLRRGARDFDGRQRSQLHLLLLSS